MKGLCIWERSDFDTEEFVQGQMPAFEFIMLNKSSLDITYQINAPVRFRLKTAKGSEDIPIRAYGEGEVKKSGRTLGKGQKEYFQFDAVFLRAQNDSFTYFQEVTGQENYYHLLKPGNYELIYENKVLPEGKVLRTRKKFKVKEAKGNKKIELIDFLTCIHYYYSLSYAVDSLIDKMYSEQYHTITWFMKKNPGSIYSAELFRFLIFNWKYTGYKPHLTEENEKKERFILMQLYPHLEGNLSGTSDYFLGLGLKVHLLKAYGLIEDEIKFMDTFLKEMENKPFELSEDFITSFKEAYKDAQLNNYAKKKNNF